MARASKHLPLFATGVGAACLIASAVAWARWPTAERAALARYSTAACISPTQRSDRTAWDTTIPLENRKFARLQASGEMRSMFELAFSDEDYGRQVTTFWDYSYPHDVRINRSTNTLWLVVSGGLGGGPFASLFDRARLYEYDLVTRTIAHEFELKPDALPVACPPSTLLEPKTSMR